MSGEESLVGTDAPQYPNFLTLELIFRKGEEGI